MPIVVQPRIHYPRLVIIPRVGLLTLPIWIMAAMIWFVAVTAYVAGFAVYWLAIASVELYRAGRRRWPRTPHAW